MKTTHNKSNYKPDKNEHLSKNHCYSLSLPRRTKHPGTDSSHRPSRLLESRRFGTKLIGLFKKSGRSESLREWIRRTNDCRRHRGCQSWQYHRVDSHIPGYLRANQREQTQKRGDVTHFASLFRGRTQAERPAAYSWNQEEQKQRTWRPSRENHRKNGKRHGNGKTNGIHLFQPERMRTVSQSHQRSLRDILHQRRPLAPGSQGQRFHRHRL